MITLYDKDSEGQRIQTKFLNHVYRIKVVEEIVTVINASSIDIEIGNDLMIDGSTSHYNTSDKNSIGILFEWICPGIF